MTIKSRLIAAPLTFGLTLGLSHFALSTALAAQEPPEAPRQVQAGESADQPVAAGEAVWAFEESDLPVDPSYHFGQLPNGMRYILRENATPEGTALVRMRIDSGSLEESEDERGLSHFLEHMAFNGSTNIPEGEMISLLEREGLAFGADTNASTGLDAITYKLDLPRNDADLLDTALMLMRETASELTIAQDAVERERGVILAEKRDRNSFARRAQEATWEFYYPDARFRHRLPIGTSEVIENASAAQIRALYERTYTPSNTVLVIVGDYPVEVMEAALQKHFADWQSGPVPTEPEVGPIDVERRGLTGIYTDPSLSESVAISVLGDWIDEPDTIANRNTQALRGIGYAIIARRMARLARGEDAPFRSASFGGGDVFEDARSTGITINTTDGDWREGLLAAVREVNQALTHGFTQAEINEQVQNSLTAAKNAVAGYETYSNTSFVGRALGLVSDERIPLEPAYRLARLEELIPSITPETVHAALLAHTLPLEEPFIRFQGRTPPEGGEEALRAAFVEGMALPIAPPEDKGIVEFAYKEFGTPGQVVSDTREERLGLRYITFANGVRLTLKQTEVKENRISFRMHVDGGSLMNTAEDPLKTYLVGSLASGGLGQHSADELQTVLAGRSVGWRIGNTADAFSFSGGTTPNDLELQMRLTAAWLTDPGYRSEGVERFRRGIDNFFENLRSTPARAYAAEEGAVLSDNDPRYVLQSKEAFYALDYDRLEAAIADRFAKGAVELAIVGDIDEDATIAAVASTIGALPQREAEFRPRIEARQRRFTPHRGEVIIRHEGEPDQATVRMVWPTTDDSDQSEVARVALLARVLQLEITDRLREDLGQAYSPRVGSAMSKTYPDYGTFTIAASVDAQQVEATRAAIRTLLDEIRAEPVDQDVIERARQPLLESYDNALKSLGGWLNRADNAQSEPDRYARWFNAPELLKAVTAQDIQAAALQYLAIEDAVEFLVLPEETQEEEEGTEETAQ